METELELGGPGVRLFLRSADTEDGRIVDLEPVGDGLSFGVPDHQAITHVGEDVSASNLAVSEVSRRDDVLGPERLTNPFEDEMRRWAWLRAEREAVESMLVECPRAQLDVYA